MTFTRSEELMILDEIKSHKKFREELSKQKKSSSTTGSVLMIKEFAKETGYSERHIRESLIPKNSIKGAFKLGSSGQYRIPVSQNRKILGITDEPIEANDTNNYGAETLRERMRRHFS